MVRHLHTAIRQGRQARTREETRGRRRRRRNRRVSVRKFHRKFLSALFFSLSCAPPSLTDGPLRGGRRGRGADPPHCAVHGRGLRQRRGRLGLRSLGRAAGRGDGRARGRGGGRALGRHKGSAAGIGLGHGSGRGRGREGGREEDEAVVPRLTPGPSSLSLSSFLLSHAAVGEAGGAEPLQ